MTVILDDSQSAFTTLANSASGGKNSHLFPFYIEKIEVKFECENSASIVFFKVD